MSLASAASTSALPWRSSESIDAPPPKNIRTLNTPHWVADSETPRPSDRSRQRTLIPAPILQLNNSSNVILFFYNTYINIRRDFLVLMGIPTHHDEIDGGAAPSLRADKTWSAVNQFPRCPHDPPCKLPLWFRALLSVYAGLYQATYVLGYQAHLYMVQSFAGGVLSSVGSEHRVLFYWCSILIFLTATLFSLRAFEHIFILRGWQIGRKSIPASFLLPMKLIIPTLFSAVWVTRGCSAQLALVAVGVSVLLGFATSAYKRENWQFRRSLAELVVGRIHGQFPRSPGTDDEELCNAEIQPDLPQEENKPQIEYFRIFPILLFWPNLYSVYVDIAHRFRDNVPGPLRNISPTLPLPSVWLSQVVFWAVAILLTCTVIHVVIVK